MSNPPRSTARMACTSLNPLPFWIFIFLMVSLSGRGGQQRGGGDTVCRTCSSPRRAVCSHSLVCSENSLLIVGVGPILNKELELIFRSDRSDRTCVYT